MNFDTSLQLPLAEKSPFQLKKHDDIRIDPYYWLRERENPEVIDYLERENDYYQKMTQDTESFREDLGRTSWSLSSRRQCQGICLYE